MDHQRIEADWANKAKFRPQTTVSVVGPWTQRETSPTHLLRLFLNLVALCLWWTPSCFKKQKQKNNPVLSFHSPLQVASLSKDFSLGPWGQVLQLHDAYPPTPTVAAENTSTIHSCRPSARKQWWQLVMSPQVGVTYSPSTGPNKHKRIPMWLLVMEMRLQDWLDSLSGTLPQFVVVDFYTGWVLDKNTRD